MIEPTNLPSDRGIASRTTTMSGLRDFDRPCGRISWGAVFAGAFIALATQLVLTLIGMAIGLATINPATGDTPSAAGLGTGAVIWLLISSLISLFSGGYIAARLGGAVNGWLHGLTTWGLVTVGSVLLLTTAAGGLIGAASGLTSFAANNAGRAAHVPLPPALQRQVDRLQSQASQAADQAATDAQQTDPDVRAARAREAAENAAKGGALGTGGAALGLILGALAAAFGGRTGQRYRDTVEVERRAATTVV